MNIKKLLILGVILTFSNSVLATQITCIILEPSNQVENGVTSVVFDRLIDTVDVELEESKQSVLFLDKDSDHLYMLLKTGPSSFNFAVLDQSTVVGDDPRTATPKMNMILEIGSNFGYVDQVNLLSFYCTF